GGTNGLDVPVPGDYDGVGHTQLAVFRPSTGAWYVLRPTGGAQIGTFGGHNLTDIPTETTAGALVRLGYVGTASSAVRAALVPSSTATIAANSSSSSSPAVTVSAAPVSKAAVSISTRSSVVTNQGGSTGQKTLWSSAIDALYGLDIGS